MKREREERLQIMLTLEELRAVDDFRYEARMPSRAAAVRELLNRGLRSLDAGVASANSRSKDFGVLEIANGSRFVGVERGTAQGRGDADKRPGNNRVRADDES